MAPPSEDDDDPDDPLSGALVPVPPGPGDQSPQRPPFAQSLRRWRRRRDLSQDDAAALLGYSRNYWVRLEKGERPPSTELLDRLAQHADACAPTLLAIGRWALEGGVGEPPPAVEPVFAHEGASAPPSASAAEPAAPQARGRGRWAPPPPPYPPYPGYPSYPPPFPPYPAYPAYPRYPAYPPRWATRRHRPRPPKRQRTPEAG